MNKKNTLSLMGIVLIVFSFFASTSLLVGDVTLAVPERVQQYSQWCWAGSSEALLNFYNQYPSQCQIANYAWNSTRCCGGPYDFNDAVKGCNKANYLYGTSGSIQGILQNWGVPSDAFDYSLTWTQNLTELDNSHPYIMRWGWTGGGGHFLVPYGYITSGSYLLYMDPWPGEGYMTSLYSWVLSASDHTWTHTLTTY